LVFREGVEIRDMLRRVLAILVLVAVPSACTAQNSAGTEGQKPPPEQGGMSTGGAYAPVLDAEHHPITAGGFVDKGPIVFQDVSARAGLTTWRHSGGTPEKGYILETLGSGVALIDFDNDGWLDIYLVNSESYPALMGKEEPTHAALFHNNHDGTFTDVARKAGVLNDRWGVGVAVGD
jgi:enediyne biosynthesis protein E4